MLLCLVMLGGVVKAHHKKGHQWSDLDFYEGPIYCWEIDQRIKHLKYAFLILDEDDPRIQEIVAEASWWMYIYKQHCKSV